MPAGVSKPLPTAMLVMLSFSASRLAKRLSGAGVKICTAHTQTSGLLICRYTPSSDWLKLQSHALDLIC